MKHLLVAVCVLFIVGNGVAQAIPGPDPDDGHTDFSIVANPSVGSGDDVKDVTTFDETTGWDFGDRTGYRCTWVEHFTNGVLDFEVHYEVLADFADTAPLKSWKLNDDRGLEGDEAFAQAYCGSAKGSNYPSPMMADAGTHFPHGTAITFYRDGQLIDSVDYGMGDHSAMCAKSYWVPGDKAGEAFLWFDADGPDSTMPGMGDCNGGPGEPVPWVRAIVEHTAPDIGYCTVGAATHRGLDEGTGDTGDLCTYVHTSTVSLRIRRAIGASGFVRVPDGTAECRSGRTVLIQRRISGVWKTVRKGGTNQEGHYLVHIKPRDGVYRARVKRRTLTTGDVCKPDTSRKRIFRLSA
jgi:hypothetical protein